MPIKINDPSDESKEIEVYTPEELQAKADEISASKDAEIAKANEEVKRLTRVSAEKTENFQKLNEMTEEQKSKLTAEQIENRRMIETANAEVARLREEKNTDTQNRIKTDTEKALARYHGGDKTLKEALEANFKIIAMEGNDTETIVERARLAAAMESGKTGRANPLMAPMRGDSPSVHNKSMTEEFLNSEKGKEAQRRMGIL